MAAITTTYISVILLLNFLCYVQCQEGEGAPSHNYRSANDGRGFGSHLWWLDFPNAMAIAKDSQKPVMLIIHASWCNSCKALKPQFATSEEISKLSENFVMVNSADVDEPKDKVYAPDGDYIPRILFLSPDGELKLEFFNEGGHPSYKYFYSDVWSIVATMKKVARTYKKKTNPNDTKEL